MKIFTINNQKEGKILRQSLKKVDFSEIPKKELKELAKKMRQIMKEAKGIGLSANQIGLNLRFFVAEVPDSQGRRKFYALANPEIIKKYEEKELLEEGCLSVPEIVSFVERPSKVIISGFDTNGRKVKIKAWGLLARVFQHEIDHLNGILFTDKAANLRKYENVRKYEK